MKKTSLKTSCLLLALTLALSLNIPAQKNDRAGKAKGNTSLETALERLERELKGSVSIDFRQRYARRTYVRLKRRGGCDIGFEVSEDPPTRNLNVSNKHIYSHPFPYAEWRMNLSDLDHAGVKVDGPSRRGDTVVRFATRGTQRLIKWENFGEQKVGQLSEGHIEIGEKNAQQVAAALEQAVIACKD